MLAWACGGAPFVVGPAGDDATADALSEIGSDQVSEPDSRGVSDGAMGDVSDASTKDGPGARDATGGDAPSLLDARAADGASGDAADADAGRQPPPSCAAGFACAPPVPGGGWTGPFELYAGPTLPPTCEANFSGQTVDGYDGLTAPAAACTCGCGQAQAVQCSSPTIGFYGTSATCNTLGSLTCATATFTPGACATVDETSPCGSLLGIVMTVPPSTASKGSCTPLGTAAVALRTWATNARACASSFASAPADCPVGSVCAPAPTAPFQAGLCIEQAGDVPCPTKDYTIKHRYFGGADDTRGCPMCSCGPVTGASCTDSVSQFASTDGGCGGLPVVYGPGHCQPVQQPADLQLALTASGGSCAPSASAPTGSASATNPSTFCCTQ
jgi:hypothetical protein